MFSYCWLRNGKGGSYSRVVTTRLVRLNCMQDKSGGQRLNPKDLRDKKFKCSME